MGGGSKTLVELWGAKKKRKVEEATAAAAERKTIVDYCEAWRVRERRSRHETWQAGVHHHAKGEWTSKVLCSRLRCRERWSEMEFASSLSENRISCLSFDSVGALLAVGAQDGIRVYETDDAPRQIARIPLESAASAVAWSVRDDAEIAAALLHAPDVVVVDLGDAVDACERDSRPPLKRILRGSGGHSGLAYVVSDEELLVACGARGKLRAWKGDRFAWELEIAAGASRPVVDACSLAAGAFLVAATRDVLSVWDATNREVRGFFGSGLEPRRLWRATLRDLASAALGSPSAVACDAVKPHGHRIVLAVRFGDARDTSAAVLLAAATHKQLLSVFEADGPLLCAPFCERALATRFACVATCATRQGTALALFRLAPDRAARHADFNNSKVSRVFTPLKGRSTATDAILEDALVPLDDAPTALAAHPDAGHLVLALPGPRLIFLSTSAKKTTPEDEAPAADGGGF